MITFFRRLRAKLLDQNNFTRYLKYAFGEILLVVIGILIALQINNLNEERKKHNRFVFGLSEMYKQIVVDIHSFKALKINLRYQFSRMDSILEMREFEDPRRIPGIIQIFDDAGMDRLYANRAWQFEFLEFNPNNQEQNEMVTELRKYLIDSDDFAGNSESTGLEQLMLKQLKEHNIPFRKFKGNRSYNNFINGYPDWLYSDQDLENVMKLIQSNGFVSDLKSIKAYKEGIYSYLDLLTDMAGTSLKFLESIEPGVAFRLEHLEITGTATESGGWAMGYPLEMVNQNPDLWHTRISLNDGEIKFRNDRSWTFDWGMNESDPTELMFRGANIPVTEGTYDINLDLSKSTITIQPI